MLSLVGLDDHQASLWDQDLGRLSVFSLDGELLETRLLGRERDLTPRLLARTTQGTFIAQLPRLLDRSVTEDMMLRDTIQLWEFEGDVDDAKLLIQRPSVTWHFTGRGQRQVPFTDGTRFAARDRWLVVTESEGSPELDVLEEGTAVRRIRLRRERVPVTREAVESLLEAWGMGGPDVDVGRLPVPGLAPAWAAVRLDPEGRVLALHHWGIELPTPDTPQAQRWDVFDAEGRFRGVLSLPAGAALLDITPDYLVFARTPEGLGPRVEVHEAPRWE